MTTAVFVSPTASAGKQAKRQNDIPLYVPASDEARFREMIFIPSLLVYNQGPVIQTPVHILHQ